MRSGSFFTKSAKIALVEAVKCKSCTLTMEPGNIQILVLDRDAASARAIRRVLAKVGYQVSVASHESDALSLASGEVFNIVVKSFDAQRIDAVALMEKVRGITPDTQFIFLSEKGTIHTAVEAMRKGAFDYLSKPIDSVQLTESVRKALEHQALVAEDQQIKQRLRRRSDPDIFAGSSGVMKQISRLIQQIAPTDVTVLIEGESGTGKEVVARAIHEKSRRKSQPFIAVNCAALPENLIEAELFGHVRGAFTGATGDRKGRFQLAQGGTLFLDEIGDLSSKGQGDLLRVLEDGTYRAVGGHKVERATARIIAATNKDLEAEAVVGGRFREDLFYRLNIVSIVMPPLRERVEDIAPLVKTFTDHFCAKHHRRSKQFKPEVIGLFQTLRWPGNVRQLRNLVERLVVTVPHGTIALDDLPSAMHQGKADPHFIAIQPGMTIAQVESELIRQTLFKVTSNREEASKMLGISRRTLQYKIKRYQLNQLPRLLPKI